MTDRSADEIDVRVRPFVGKKLNWPERMDMIRKTFPDPNEFDFRGPWGPGDEITPVFAAIMRDLLKVDQAVPGKPGPRPALDYRRGVESLRKFSGQDHTTLPFVDAFRILVGGLSLTQVARRTKLARSRVYRLLQGDIEPQIADLRAIAEGFKKHASFFAEYRSAYVLAHLQTRLLGAPESTIDFYTRITKMQRRSSEVSDAGH